MAACMTVGMTSALTGCGSKKNETITLEVYSQLANYSGLQTGWIADILKDKFNVKLKITAVDSRCRLTDVRTIAYRGRCDHEKIIYETSPLCLRTERFFI